jgi:hypothetical protein
MKISFLAGYKIIWKNTAKPHGYCMLDTSDYKYTLWIYNTYCFSTPTVVRRTYLNIALISTLPVWVIPNVVSPFLYVSLISCDYCYNTLILPLYYFYIQASFVELAFRFRSCRWQNFGRQGREYFDCVCWFGRFGPQAWLVTPQDFEPFTICFDGGIWVAWSGSRNRRPQVLLYFIESAGRIRKNYEISLNEPKILKSHLSCLVPP